MHVALMAAVFTVDVLVFSLHWVKLYLMLRIVPQTLR